MQAAGPSTNGKKTLQQIQREEEALARKQKAMAAAANNVNAFAVSNAAQTALAGKRYADLAGKAAAPPNASGGAWTTVGAGGKPKTPAVPTAPSNFSKPVTGNTPANVAAAAAKTKPVSIPARTASINTSVSAQDEFKKWAVGELRPDLNKGIQGEHDVGRQDLQRER